MPKVRYVIGMVCFSLSGVNSVDVCECKTRENAEWVCRGLGAWDKMHTYHISEVVDVQDEVKYAK